ncbi:MAG: ATPase, partial [bacterium]|nr:ATPase [bacterium]
DEEEEVYEDDEDWEEEESEWSCLDKRPALMGDDSVEEEGSDDEYQDEYDDAEQ